MRLENEEDEEKDDDMDMDSKKETKKEEEEENAKRRKRVNSRERRFQAFLTLRLEITLFMKITALESIAELRRLKLTM